METTSILREQVKGIRKMILDDILTVVLSKKNMKVKFGQEKAPRIYYDGSWREIIQISVEFSALRFAWHDERCVSQGANACVGESVLSTETLLSIHELL